MLTLYINPKCPYCIKTMEVAKELHSILTIKSKVEEGVTEEVITLGGTQQFPFLTDSENGTKLYESDDIIAYLRAHPNANNVSR